jgi:hypothetical protein
VQNFITYVALCGILSISIKTDCSLACFKEMNLQQLQEEMIVVLLASIFGCQKNGNFSTISPAPSLPPA